MLAHAILLALVAAPALAQPRVLRDVAYGAHAEQRYDVYLPDRPRSAPIVLMAHGGGWKRGDKAMGRVVDAKVARWIPKGIIVVSVDYRMQPDAAPLEQARDVARALADVQRRAPSWGGDPSRVILAGHSAGGHLVALLSASPSLAVELGARRWLGALVLDAGALDVPAIMRARHLPLFDLAFGRDSTDWRAASPQHALTRQATPMLAVCSSRRRVPCPQARAFAARARGLGVRLEVLPQDLSHGEINADLGVPGAYTDAVERFMASLDPVVATRLGTRGR
ncbi:MAG TPA: alpha/beta hydrolase [Gemmatimonadaceae bacterium]|nr:alpha/beta hydrolase [Gemmatimonadaceae bacterium]